jgi:hypothetical protein
MAMKLPSLNHLFNRATDTIKRFPFECLFVLIGSYAAINLTTDVADIYLSQDWNVRLLMMSLIGLPLSLSASLFTKQKAYSALKGILIKCFVAGISFILLYILHPETHPQDIIHFALLNLAAHLLTSFVRFLDKDDSTVFWEFNRNLITLLIYGIFYSLVVALGLSAAFSAANSLFALNLDWRNLQKIWIISFSVVNTLYVLSGITKHFEKKKEEYMYPRGLKVFSQYILIPLATIYLAILVAYELKIILEWQLPKGMVSMLILGYAAIGMLALLLVYPISDQKGNGWVKIYSKYFYIFLIPLLVLLFLSVITRINDYGLTNYRYVSIALAIWLAFLTLYFLLYKKATIKAIPISLFAIVILIIYGPISATGISLRSQSAILLHLFKEEKAIKNGKLVPLRENQVNSSRAVRMASALDYILQNYDLQALQPLLTINLSNKLDSVKKTYKGTEMYGSDHSAIRYATTSLVQEYLGLSGYEYGQNYTQEQIEKGISTNYYLTSKEGISSIKGYDYMLVKDLYLDTLKTDTVAGHLIKQQEDFDHHNLIINIDSNIFTFSTSNLATQLLKQTEIIKPYQDHSTPQGLNKSYSLPQKMLQMSKQKASLVVTAQIKELNFTYSKQDGLMISSVQAYYFIKIK